MKADKLKNNSEKYFDSVAEKQVIIEEPALCYDIVIQILKEACSFRSLADISCGTGEMLRKLAEQYGEELALYGVDLSEKSIAVARRKVPDNVNLQTGDVEHLPLKNGCVDVVLNMHSFHHYPHPVNALKEFGRILKSGGTFYLVENNYKGFERHIINFRIKMMRHFQGDIKMFSRKELTGLLRENGFVIISVEEIADHSILFICRKG